MDMLSSLCFKYIDDGYFFLNLSMPHFNRGASIAEAKTPSLSIPTIRNDDIHTRYILDGCITANHFGDSVDNLHRDLNLHSMQSSLK
jgi:hypothetical protein